MQVSAMAIQLALWQVRGNFWVRLWQVAVNLSAAIHSSYCLCVQSIRRGHGGHAPSHIAPQALIVSPASSHT